MDGDEGGGGVGDELREWENRGGGIEHAEAHLEFLAAVLGICALFSATTKVVIENVRTAFESLQDLGAASYCGVLIMFAWGELPPLATRARTARRVRAPSPLRYTARALADAESER